MSGSYFLLESAKNELQDSAVYYEQKSPGLGDEFLDEFEQGIKMILSFPEAWGQMDAHFRRFLLRRFPFGIIYRMDGDTLIITSVMHLSRHPESWQKNR